MDNNYQPLFSEAYLWSIWQRDFQSYVDTYDKDVLKTLSNWSEKEFQKETAAEGSFVSVFFKKLWNYKASGESSSGEGYSCYPQYPVKRAGERGGTGEADLALGYFGLEETISKIPQVLCEFKDIRSGLDNPQKRKGNDRSPVKQCFDYLREAKSPLTGNEPVSPSWGIVSDMNEFRLYYYKDLEKRYQKFIIRSNEELSLLSTKPEGQRKRFFFWKNCSVSSFSRLLLPLAVNREFLFNSIVKFNPDFKGTKGRLVRITQRLLDRFIFILFCEDMGDELNFPRNLLRDLLIKESLDADYDSEDSIIWERIKKLFGSMREGKPFREIKINKFNGGLFEEDAEIESLKIPSFVFCIKNQGVNPESILKSGNTLLYFSAKYNFGESESGGDRSITLITLGRIFEQSITELEIMEAKADDRISLMELSKRKTDGVYYTPEWVTKYIVEETVGRKLEDIKKEIGLTQFPEISIEEIKKQQATKKTKKLTHSPVIEYLRLLDIYSERLDKIKVIDPACGSGAFLIQAYKYLLQQRQWIANERERVEGHRSIFDTDKVIKSILSNNIYGVDINSESVEITRLAIWLNTARPDATLSSLDKNIVCGNTLIAHDFYSDNVDKDGQLGFFSETQKERINVFDWEKAFPEIFSKGGFDCVIGNPPYVKLQNFRTVQPEMSNYLIDHKTKGKPLYASTQTGNFDLYLPFIEKGIELLNPEGRMGYIAPNVWVVNEYGEGLRKKIKENKRFERWVDFKSFQVFEEAITYTSLQFFRGKEVSEVKCYFASDGDISKIDWDDSNVDTYTYAELPEDAWVFAPKKEKELMEKLNASCVSLENSTKQIFQGLVTSADYVYHLEKIGQNRYKQTKKDKSTIEVNIEDEIMHPLVSGTDAKRYILPDSNMRILFPYKIENDKGVLIPAKEFEKDYPLAWKYLLSNEKDLRSRENSKMDNDTKWWGYVYPKSLDKQKFPKLLIPRLIISLFAVIDDTHEYFLDNVDVGGILVKEKEDLFFLGGILNAPVANFVWRRISKPFQNDYRSANKQFIAPLPIPKANENEKKQVADLAKELQSLHTERRDKIAMIDKRLESSQVQKDKRKPSWIWVEADNKNWFETKLESINTQLFKGAKLSVSLDKGELQFFINGISIFEIFLEEKESSFIYSQWKQKIRQINVTEKYNAKSLVTDLLDLVKTENSAVKDQVTALDKEIDTLDKTISVKEKEMNAVVYGLYQLTGEEIQLVSEQ